MQSNKTWQAAVCTHGQRKEVTAESGAALFRAIAAVLDHAPFNAASIVEVDFSETYPGRQPRWCGNMVLNATESPVIAWPDAAVVMEEELGWTEEDEELQVLLAGV